MNASEKSSVIIALLRREENISCNRLISAHVKLAGSIAMYAEYERQRERNDSFDWRITGSNIEADKSNVKICEEEHQRTKEVLDYATNHFLQQVES